MRIVIKIGSSSLHDGHRTKEEVLVSISGQIAKLRRAGHAVVIVSSGAIAFGRAKFGEQARPHEGIPAKQAYAAVGQPLLMNAWSAALSKFKLYTGQILVTNQELFRPKDSVGHIHDSFNALIELGVVPIVNENDAVAVDEIVLGDNDTLSAHVAHIIGADSLFILGTASALYEDYPICKRRIPAVVAKDISTIEPFCKETTDPQGTGGMLTKIAAIKEALAGETVKSVYITTSTGKNCIENAILGSEGTV